jgi:hypothetical protein
MILLTCVNVVSGLSVLKNLDSGGDSVRMFIVDIVLGID